MKKLFFFLLVLFITKISFSQVSIDTAVNFTIKDTKGNIHNLYEYLEEGKYVLVDFFKVGCGPCQTYFPHISRAFRYFGCNAHDVIIIGINYGATNEAVDNFAAQFNGEFPCVSGIDGSGNSVYDDYGIIAYPTLALIAPNKLILEKNIENPIFDTLVNTIKLHGCEAADCDIKINNVEENKFISFNNKSLIVNIEYLKHCKLIIYNALGQIKLETTVNNESNIINISHLSNNFYIAKLIHNNKCIGTLKFVNN